MAISIADLTNTTVVHNASATATPETDVRGGPTTLMAVYVDNSVTNAAPVFIKFYDDVDPTVGTTDPVLILEIEGNGTGDTKKVNDGDVFMLVNGLTGIPFDNALSYAAVLTGGTGGTDNPSQTTKVTLIVS